MVHPIPPEMVYLNLTMGEMIQGEPVGKVQTDLDPSRSILKPDTEIDTDVLTTQNEKSISDGFTSILDSIKNGMRKFIQPVNYLDKEDIPFSEKPQSPIWNIAMLSPLHATALFANVTTFVSRQFGFFPFPHYDKISDITGSMSEPIIQGRWAKLVMNQFLNVLNKKIFSKMDREIFYYDSLTKQELKTAIALYGGLWITSEIAALGPYRPIQSSTPDVADIPAHIIGLIGAYKIGTEFIKRFPQGRFADMEKSVGIELVKNRLSLEKSGTKTVDLLGRSLIDQEDMRETSKAFLMEYKKIVRLIITDLIRRSIDVKESIGDNREQLQSYGKFINLYARALSRQWFINQLTASGRDQKLMSHHEQRLKQAINNTQQAAENYREKVGQIRIKEQPNK